MSKNWFYQIIPDLKLTIVLFRDVVHVHDMINFAQYVSTKENYNKEFNLIISFRHAELSISEKDVKKWIQFVANTPEFIGKRKTAFLTAKPVDVVIGTLYNEWKGDLPISVNVFSTLSAAVKWIYLSLDLYPRIIDEIVALELQINKYR